MHGATIKITEMVSLWLFRCSLVGPEAHPASCTVGRLHLKRDGTSAETRFRLSPKRTSPFKSAGASAQSTAGSRVVHINVSNAG